MTQKVVEQPAAVIRDLEGKTVYTIHVVKGVQYGFPLWSQRDQRWSKDQLGTSRWTLGQRGCLVTAIAMGVTNAIDTEITPKTLNAQLTVNSGYVDGGSLVFAAVERLYPAMQLQEVVDCRFVPAPAADIARWVADGQVVVVKIDMDLTDPDVDEHWVLLVSGTQHVFQIHDPWPVAAMQRPLELPPAYCKQGWTPARAIYRYARYGMPKG